MIQGVARLQPWYLTKNKMTLHFNSYVYNASSSMNFETSFFSEIYHAKGAGYSKFVENEAF